MPQDPDGHIVVNVYNSSSSSNQELQQQLSVSASRREDPPREEPVDVDDYIGQSIATVSVEPDEELAAARPAARAPSSSSVRQSRPGQQAQRDGGPQFKHQVRDVSSRSTFLAENSQVQEIGPSFSMIRDSNTNAPDGSDVATGTTSVRGGGEDETPPILAHAKLLPDESETQNETEHTTLSSKKVGEVSNNVNASCYRRDKYVILALGVLLVAGVVGAVLGLGGFQQDEDGDAFSQVGDSLQGTSVNFYLGAAIALSETGFRMAVASPSVVQVYEQQREQNGNWKQRGNDIVLVMNGDADATTNKRLNLQGHEMISVAMDAAGETLIAGYGQGNFEMGLAKVFRYDARTNDWVQAGQNLTGTEVGDRFGASVSMNAEGDVIAVGAPGQEGDLGSVTIFQREVGGEWAQRGLPIVGENSSTVSELGRSVSLSASGDRVASGARSAPAFGSMNHANAFFNVVSVWEYDRFGNLEWTQLGKGISGVSSSKSTGWYVDLDATGSRMAVSNAYLREVGKYSSGPSS